MRETYLQFYEIVDSYLKIIFFYYTIYEIYKIGYALRVKKNIIEVVKTNKMGFLAIFSFTVSIIFWLFWIKFMSMHEAPIFTPKDPNEWSYELSKEELENESTLHAKYTFIYSNKNSLRYDAKLDEWYLFAPTDADIKEHDDRLIQDEHTKHTIDKTNDLILLVATLWLAVGLIGWHSARREQ